MKDADPLIKLELNPKWIPKLFNVLNRNYNKRQKELEEINTITYGDPLELARYYVEPDCQELNPADWESEDHPATNMPIMKAIKRFFGAPCPTLGSNQLFILSDAGMGKTAFLTMLKLQHLMAFWPQWTDCVLLKLGENSLSQIAERSNTRKTILLLDSLDEDPMSYGRILDRLCEILEGTKNFLRVIIACRTQFFLPNVEKNPMKRPDRVSIGGFTCPAKYISYFDRDKVAAYLIKRFPKKWGLFPQTERIDEAEKMITRMGILQCRPLLLAYIEDLLESPYIKTNPGDYVVYQALIESWLRREQEKSGVSWKKLKRACELLALEMQKGDDGKGVQRHISEAKLNIFIEEMSDFSYVKKIDIKGRSLLNRNADGDFRFSHFSIQEFLVVNHVIENSNYRLDSKTVGMDLVLRFLSQTEKGKKHLKHFDLVARDLSSCNLSVVDFRGTNLSRTKFNNVNFRQSNLSYANLSYANLSGADLSGAYLSGAYLYLANLSGADLRGANLSGADLGRTNLKNSKLDHKTIIDDRWRLVIEIFAIGVTKRLRNIDLSEANLSEANLRETDFSGADLSRADLSRALLSNADLSETDLSGANFSGAYLYLANLSGADLSRANFSSANFCRAILSRANLSETDLTEANLSYAILNGANFSGADLKGANLLGADLEGAIGLPSS